MCLVVCATFILDGFPGKSNEKVWAPVVSQVSVLLEISSKT